MHVEQLPYDYPLRPNFQRLSDLRPGGPFQRSLSVASRDLDITRPYERGDPLRSLDWRILARRNEWVIRRHYPATHHRYTIVIDGSETMHWPTPDLNKAHHLSDDAKWRVALRLGCHLSYNLGGGYQMPQMLVWTPKRCPEENTDVDASGVKSSHHRHRQPQPSLASGGSSSFSLRSVPIRSKSDAKELWDLSHSEVSLSKVLSAASHNFRSAANTLAGSHTEPSLSTSDLSYNTTTPQTRNSRWLMITDALHPEAREFLRARTEIRVIHLLSRLEQDFSWLRPDVHYRWGMGATKWFRGKKLRRGRHSGLSWLSLRSRPSSARVSSTTSPPTTLPPTPTGEPLSVPAQSLKALSHCPALRRDHMICVHTYQSVEGYLDLLGEVL